VKNYPAYQLLVYVILRRVATSRRISLFEILRLLAQNDGNRVSSIYERNKKLKKSG